jgi:small-conductance mechanosensitive channel
VNLNLLHDPRVQLLLGLLLITGLFGWLVRSVLRRVAHEIPRTGEAADRRLRQELLRGAIAPLSLLVWYYGLWAAAHVAITSDWVPASWQWIDTVLWRIASVGLFISGLWFFYRATRVVDRRLQHYAAGTASRVDDVILPLIGTALRLTVPILALFLFTRLSRLPADTIAVANKLLTIALIAALTWILRRGILLIDAAVIGPRTPATPAERALFTRVRVLRKIAIALVMVFAVSAVLMSFEEVRDIGRSMLASAGIAGIVVGFAAQRSLGNLFAGLQIALTQPIRIGDQVLVEGDVGNVEEITLTYVVVCVWDQRRIVLPISYFIEKPFQNWTRVATNMLSPLTLRMDFSLPIGELRDYLQREIAKSTFWDKKVFGVQVTNADDRSMEVRVLASAPDSGASFNLQCELREKAIDFVRRHYPQCLPKQRREQKQMDVWRAWTDGNGRDNGAASAAPAAQRS